jgi:hypothetical protein
LLTPDDDVSFDVYDPKTTLGDCRKLAKKSMTAGSGCWLAHAKLSLVDRHMPYWKKDPCANFQVKEMGCDAPASFIAANTSDTSYLWLESPRDKRNLAVHGSLWDSFFHSTNTLAGSSRQDEKRNVRTEVELFANDYRDKTPGVKAVHISYCVAKKAEEKSPFPRDSQLEKAKLPKCSDLRQPSCLEEPGEWYWDTKTPHAKRDVAPYALCYGSCQKYIDLKSFALGKNPHLPRDSCGQEVLGKGKVSIDYVREGDPRIGSRDELNAGVKTKDVVYFDGKAKLFDDGEMDCGWQVGNSIKSWFTRSGGSSTSRKMAPVCGFRKFIEEPKEEKAAAALAEKKEAAGEPKTEEKDKPKDQAHGENGSVTEGSQQGETSRQTSAKASVGGDARSAESPAPGATQSQGGATVVTGLLLSLLVFNL